MSFKNLGEVRAALQALGIRKPEWRVFKSELPLCGVLTRKGTPCQAKAAWDEYRCAPKNGRCRLHGGASTGPRTEEGLARSTEGARAAQLRRWERYREEKGRTEIPTPKNVEDFRLISKPKVQEGHGSPLRVLSRRQEARGLPLQALSRRCLLVLSSHREASQVLREMYLCLHSWVNSN